MKKVLLVSAGNIERGGVEVFLLTWIRHLPKDIYDISWYFPGDIEDEKFAQEFRKEGIKIIAGQDPFKQGANWEKVRRCAKEWRSVRQLLRNERYDIVHVNTGNMLYQAIIASASFTCGVPVRIAHSHNSVDGESASRQLANSVLRFGLVHGVNRYAACSRKAAEYLFGKRIGDKALIIKNCIDTEKFRFSREKREEVRRRLGLEDSYVVGHVGSFNKQKNHRFLIDVFRGVSEKEPRAKLLLVGGGELEEEVRRQTAEYGLTDKVVFAGVTDQVQDYMSAMDVFVLPSIFEGFPFVGIEAQANGLPCVMSDAVTKEIYLLDMVEYVSLNDPVVLWVKTIMASMAKAPYNRERAFEALRLSGWDTRDMGKYIDALYRGKDQ